MREPSAFALRGWRLPAAGPLSTQRFRHRDPQARARSTSYGRGADHADLREVQVQRASGGGCGSECRRVLSSTRPESRRARTRPVPRHGHAVRPGARGPCAVADRFVFCVCEIQVSKAHSSGQATTSPESKDGADALHGVQRNKREAAVAPGHEGGTPGGQKLPALLAAPAPQPAQPGEDRRTSTWPNGCRGRTCRVDGRGRSSGSRRGLFLCALLDSLPLSSRRPVNPLHTRTPSRLRRRAQRHEDAQHAPRTRVAGRSQVGQTRDADYSTF